MDRPFEVRWQRIVGAVVLSAGAVIAAAGIETKLTAQQELRPVGLPEDWSHRHIVFSDPGVYADLLKPGVSQSRWSRWLAIQKDPRYLIQVRKKERDRALRVEQELRANGLSPTPANRDLAVQPAVTNVSASPTLSSTLQTLALAASAARRRPTPTPPVQRDWSNVMGGQGGAGGRANFPAKYNFRLTSKDCASDFVVYTTAANGVTGSGVLAFRNGSYSAVAQSGDTVTVTNGARTLIVTAGASDLGLTFTPGLTAATSATNLAKAINRNGGVVGVTASSPSAGVVRVTSITHGTGSNSIALSRSVSSAGRFNWDAATLGSGSGTAGQPTIFALNNLYKGDCETSDTAAVPSTMWAYNTGSNFLSDLSPVLSYYDGGAQVAFSQTGAFASLVLLKWSAASPGTIGAPVVPGSVTAANYRGCTAPCMLVLPFSGSAANSNSAPFVDYASDTLYVGDNTGKLHKFTGVFQGTPQEAGTPWPVPVASGRILSAPVYDSVSQLVFVGSARSTTVGGQLHAVDGSGNVVSSAVLAADSSVGIQDAPIVDSTAQRVYAFVNRDRTTTCNGGSPCMAVVQFSTAASISGATGTPVQVGKANYTNVGFHAGTFDHAYFNSPSQTNPTGSLYVCGTTNTADLYRPALWRIPILANVMGAPVSGPTLVSTDLANSRECSPVTEIAGATQDRLFVSVQASGGDPTCLSATGCVYMYQAPLDLFNAVSTSSSAPTTTDAFLSVSQQSGLNASELAVATTVTASTAGTLNSITIVQGAPSPAGTTYTYTLRKNGADSTGVNALTCAIAATNSSCTDPGILAIAAGDTVDVRVARTGGSGTLTTTFAVQLFQGVSLSGGSTASAGLPAVGGASGMIIDNTVAGGGSQIYFGTLTSPGNAVQASQAGLQ